MQLTKKLQQDKENFDSDTSHEEKVLSFFKDVTYLAFVPFHQWGKSTPLNAVSLYQSYVIRLLTTVECNDLII